MGPAQETCALNINPDATGGFSIKSDPVAWRHRTGGLIVSPFLGHNLQASMQFWNSRGGGRPCS